MQEMKILPLLFLLTLGASSSKSYNEHVCTHLTPKNNPILSNEVYRDLIRSLEWDIGQHGLKSSLTQNHNHTLECLFLDGFSFKNLLHCLGDDYLTVLEEYQVILKGVQQKLIQAVADYLEFRGYDNMAFDAFNDLKLHLTFDLEANDSPWESISQFEQEIQGKLPTDMTDLSDFRHEFQFHYVVYLSFKRIMKGYIFLTVNCVREVVGLFDIEVDGRFPLNTVPEEHIEQVFPDAEVDQNSDTRQSIHEKVKQILRGEGDGFNHDMARQGKFKTIVAAHLATGKMDKSQLDATMTPEEIIRKFVYGHDPEGESNHSH